MYELLKEKIAWGGLTGRNFFIIILFLFFLAQTVAKVSI